MIIIGNERIVAGAHVVKCDSACPDVIHASLVLLAHASFGREEHS